MLYMNYINQGGVSEYFVSRTAATPWLIAHESAHPHIPSAPDPDQSRWLTQPHQLPFARRMAVAHQPFSGRGYMLSGNV